ncbi:MAG TPA: glycosyltransferase family 2 protein [Bryobacteraceae bacterium]|nr:glycosyltransferase family 2 protein [Bryobacteraceae bacterium]
MPDILVSVVIPTLAADSRLEECVESLEHQTRRDFEVIIVDNSGGGLVRRNGAGRGARVIENSRNAGFGAAVNQGFQASAAPFLATLNDDAVAHPDWLDALLRAIQRRPDAGMCASQVRFFGEHRLDSAGMLMARDGSSKQRGHGRPPEDFPVPEETLFPSGSAALYRRAMLDSIGFFDDRFFLYCEDTDLGLRARWGGWKCLYEPLAMVEHHYSHSAGGTSPIKAYYVERNRLFVLVKNFPAGMLLAAPFATLARYLWHAWYILQGRGSAARFRAEGHAGPKMIWYIIRAHAALLAHVPRLWRQRREIRGRARITPAVFRHLMRCHSISARKVAAL